MWEYFDKSEFIFSTDFSYYIFVWEKNRCTLKKRLDFNIEQAEIEFKKIVNEYRDRASGIVLSIDVTAFCSTKVKAATIKKNLKKIYPNYTILEGPKILNYQKIAMCRGIRYYFPETNQEHFEPDYWGLDKPNK